MPEGKAYLSNHTRMSTIQPRRREKKAKNLVTLTRKLPCRKGCSTTHQPFLSSNPKIPNDFPQTFPTKMKPCKYPARQNRQKKKKQKKRGREKAKRKKAHARTSEANIFAASGSTIRPLSVRPASGFCDMFLLFIGRQ